MYLKVEISSYLAHLNERNYSSKTIKKRQGTLTKYSDLFTDLSLHSIDLYVKHISHLKSVNAYLSDLRCFIKHLENEGKIPTGLSKKIELQKCIKSLPKIMYTPEEIVWTIDSIPEKSEHNIRHKAMFYLLYGTAMRIGELIELRPIHLNVQQNKVHIVKGKGKKDRVVPMPQKVSDYLQYYIQIKKYPSRYLFSHKGNKLSASFISYSLRSYFPKGFSFHDFRHHCAIHLLERGVSIRYIQVFLGHEDIRTTTIYTKIHKEHLKKKYRKTHPLQRLEK